PRRQRLPPAGKARRLVVGEAVGRRRREPCTGAERLARRERRPWLRADGAVDGCGESLREGRVGEGPARTGAREDRRTVSGEAELPLEPVAQVLQLGDHVVAPIVTAIQAVEVLPQVHADDDGAAGGKRACDVVAGGAPALAVGEQENERGG